VASGAGEGIYWKYESALKNGMLNCIRLLVQQENYLQLEPLCTVMLLKDTLLDDFIISLRVAQEGYTIQYDRKHML
jgi:hypothetical protein